MDYHCNNKTEWFLIRSFSYPVVFTPCFVFFAIRLSKPYLIVGIGFPSGVLCPVDSNLMSIDNLTEEQGKQVLYIR